MVRLSVLQKPPAGIFQLVSFNLGASEREAEFALFFDQVDKLISIGPVPEALNHLKNQWLKVEMPKLSVRELRRSSDYGVK